MVGGPGSHEQGNARFFGRWQAFWFYPLLTLEGLNLHFSGFRALFNPKLKHRGVEATLLIAHAVLYVTVLLLVPTPLQALVFFAVHQGLWGIYMGSVLAPGHKGIPILRPGEKLDFLRRQVLTTRNVRGGRFVDDAMGGLNYQIEHHLFPSMPSRTCAARGRSCERTAPNSGCRTHETELIISWAETLRHLHRVGAPIRGDALFTHVSGVRNIGVTLQQPPRSGRSVPGRNELASSSKPT